jgi:hypothetical protein
MSVFENEPSSYSDTHDRHIKMSWDLGEIVNADGYNVTATAQLSVMHYSTNRSYLATIQRVDVSRENGFRVERFTIVGGTRVRLASAPCPRYSAKGLKAAADAALAELRSRVDEDAIKAVADPNTPA